jgi:hypothetical protein
MKGVALLLITAVASGCYTRKEIQVEIVNAQLVRIDTIYRYSASETKQQLTWRDSQNIEYVSYAPLQTTYMVGTRMAVLRTK